MYISCYILIENWLALTVSNKDDVTAALVTALVLMFARTGAPNPIEESWRLQWMQHIFYLHFPFYYFFKYTIFTTKTSTNLQVKPF